MQNRQIATAKSLALPKRQPSPIRERPGGKRKTRRKPHNVAVLERPLDADEQQMLTRGQKRGQDNEESDKRSRHTYRRLTQSRRLEAGEAGLAEEENEDEGVAFAKVPDGFAQSYFLSPACARPLTEAYIKAARSWAPEGAEPLTAVTAEDVDLQFWHEQVKNGFTLLVQGVGSKYSLLEAFADRCLTRWARVVRIRAFVSTFSFADALRDVLQTLFPTARCTGHNSVDALVASVRQAFQSGEPRRRVCFLVHNLECLSVPHQAALATLAATPGFYVVASVDSIWAPLLLSPHTLKNFNFSREEAHTFKSYDVEVTARYPGGFEDSTGKGQAPKACLGVVLKTLSPVHTELVQIIAEQQLANGGLSGISVSQLLEKTADHMIASTSTRLRVLLNELKDHKVVVESKGAGDTVLLTLTCSAKVLQRLADQRHPDASDGSDESDKENMD